jgi:putative flippase GtrA
VKDPGLCAIGVRWMKFNVVGTAGVGVQLGALELLTALLPGHYLLATALAVESAVLHNFVWHECFTWADRRSLGWRHARQWRHAFLRLLRFNLTTGAISIGGNLVMMRLLVGQVHLPPVPANLSGIAVCSVVNFLVSNRWVFQISGQFPP